MLCISLGMSVFTLAACGGADEAADNKNEEPATQEEAPAETEEGAEQPEMPEPDLEGIPEIVAEVNGEEIPKKEFETAYTSQFQQVAMQSQMSGEEVDQAALKTQLAESMVGQKLLIQEADKRKFEASQEAIDKTIEDLVAQNGMESKEQFLTAVEEQGTSEDEVMTQIATQVKVDQLVAEEAGDTKATDEELKALYEQVKTQQAEMGGEEVPAFEKVKPDLEAQVKMQKESEAVQALVAELRESADVKVNL